MRPVSTSDRPFRIRSRSRLIAATVLFQALVIGLGWMVTLRLAREGLFTRTHERIVDDIMRVADHFNTALTGQVNSPVTPGSAQWEVAQTLVESYRLPDGASVFLLDESGRVLCHPSLRHNPNLSRLDYSEETVSIGFGDVIDLGDLRPARAITGEADGLGGPVSLALVYNPAARATIVVHQPQSGVVAAGNRITAGLLLVCGIAGMIVLGTTVMGSIFLVRRYDTVLMRANHALEEEVESRTRRGLAIRNGLIFGLAKLADYRDTDTGRHLERICRYCELLAAELKSTYPEIDQAWIERLKLASSMHDIGKVGIPDSILLKPGALTADERKQMETHPLIGADTLVAIRRRVGDDDLINMGIQVTLSHHERFDGKGYPYGLSDDQVPLAARIVALADMYDALTSKRVYKAAMSHEQACRIIRDGRGKNFDPVIVDAFDRIEAAFDETRLSLKPDDAQPDRTVLRIPPDLLEYALPAAA